MFQFIVLIIILKTNLNFDERNNIMPVTKSPLRYPGGKTQLHKFVSNIMEKNGIKNGIYCEPFSGGAGVAIELLLSNKVDSIILNDYDIGIFSIWNAILNDTKKFIDLIEKTAITIEEWKKQKEIYHTLKSEKYSIDLAFATFYLNRTNRSGIILGGPIGNMSQNGAYKIDCRFKKTSLIEKINAIANEKTRIELYNMDAKELVDKILIKKNIEKLFVFFDPPYYKQGKNLYTNFFKHDDHVNLSNTIKSLEQYSWITTYDYHEEIKNMYVNFPILEYFLRYSVNKKRKEKEYLIHSKNISVFSFDKVEFL